MIAENKGNVYLYVGLGIVALIVVYFLISVSGVPEKPIHWHPYLKIIIKGSEVPIPADIGVKTGNIIDTDIGMDMGMSPTHTHSEDGKIHMENNNPAKKPETLTLGYFFKVWGETFNESCIFEYCNGPEGTVKMTVNGQPNYEFGDYKMKDGDRIVIEYG